MTNVNLIGIILLAFLASSSLLAQQSWDARLYLVELNCNTGEARYQLQLKSGGETPWYLADQNYRLFFDADMLSVRKVNSLLPEGLYGAANVDQNLSIRGEGQEAYSPLDHIDEHLGFLDFSIVRLDKSVASTSVLLKEGQYTAVAEIVMSLSTGSLDELKGAALNIYFSRASTAGMITRQYCVITEHYEDGHTRAAAGGAFHDLDSTQGWDAKPAIVCDQLRELPNLKIGEVNRSELEGLMQGYLSVVPNPSRGHFTYQIFGSEPEADGAHEMKIYDQSGRLLKQQNVLNNAGRVYQATLEGVPSGSYVLRVIKGDRSYQAPLIIIHD